MGTDRWARRWPVAAIAAVLVIGAIVAALGAAGVFSSGSKGRKHRTAPGPGTTAAPRSGGGADLAGFFGDAFALQKGRSFGLDRATVQPSGDPRFPLALRVEYPRGSASQLSAKSDSTAQGGAQVYLPLTAGPRDEAYLRYYAYFPAGFDFVKGGKLPGLYGGDVTSGRKIPDGTNGFSTRYMWRAHGAAEVYAYLPSSKEHGTSLGRGDWSWPTGEWAAVEQHVRLNNPGSADGEIQVWLNGNPVLDKRGVTFRTAGNLHIDGLFFSTFFGGGDESWATPRDQFAKFAGFQVSDRRIGEAAASGSHPAAAPSSLLLPSGSVRR
jgi:hypothetical protein